MAKATYTGTCACGAEVTVTTTKANRSDADAWEAWMVGREVTCSDCYRKSREATREKYNTEKAQQNADKGFPALEGSAKQVAWAETIRAQYLGPIPAESWAKIEEIAADENTPAKERIYATTALNARARTSAKWYIENGRYTDVVREITNAVSAELGK